MRSPPPLPACIGPVEFDTLSRMVAVRCPKELAHIVQRAGGVWEPGSRRWLVDRRRIGPVIRALEAATDPLFRRAGLDLDHD
jgi:hypothetical protein